MKSFMLSFLLSCGCFLMLPAQSVNDVPLTDIEADYIQIVGTGKFLSTKVTIEIDFGQRDKMWNSNDTQVKDADGTLMDFNSMIDALNFFSDNGYEFVNAFAITVSNKNVYHYMMKRKEG